MKKINRFYHRFDSTEIGNGARIMAWVFAILNLPGFIFSVFFFYAWPITIPGMILYVNYWRSGFDRLSFDQTRNIWIGTLVYNLALLVVGGLIFLNNYSSLEQAILLLPSLLGSGMAGISLKALQAHQENQENKIAEAIIEIDDEIENSETSPGPVVPTAVENWAIS